MRISKFLQWAENEIKPYSDDPRLEAEYLLAHALKINRTALLSKLNSTLSGFGDSGFGILQEYVARRKKHEPLDYIVGYQPFLGLDFVVNKSVLIPRPETELLVESATTLMTLAPSTPCLILDIGTGSGVIAVSLAKKLPNAQILAVDSSKEALAVAKKNAEKHGTTKQIKFILGDLFPSSQNKYDLIISNPPYIPTADIEKLDPNVRDWEPRMALDGGKDGLDIIRKILRGAPKYLKQDGQLMFEFGFGQADEILKLAKKEKCYQNIQIINDYANVPRIFSAVARSA
ncbi:MAG: peptide chain release factor N(5)-glutamine methyltransferase [Candidatus Margulisiibacteriota bacterium]